SGAPGGGRAAGDALCRLARLRSVAPGQDHVRPRVPPTNEPHFSLGAPASPPASRGRGRRGRQRSQGDKLPLSIYRVAREAAEQGLAFRMVFRTDVRRGAVEREFCKKVLEPPKLEGLS